MHSGPQTPSPEARARLSRSRSCLLPLILLLALGLVLVGASACSSTQPNSVGRGDLQACPPRPNCVSSLAKDKEHQTTALLYQGSEDQARALLRTVIGSMPRTRIVIDRAGYLYATFTTRLMRFVDDVEFVLRREPATGSTAGAQGSGQVMRIDLRSASRVGYSDWGVNRARVAEIRRRFLERAGDKGGRAKVESPK